MNDKDIDRFLGKLEVPQPAPEMISMAREKARLALKHRNNIPVRSQKPLFFGALGAAAVACLALIIVLPRSHESYRGTPNDFDTPWTEFVNQQSAIYGQMNRMFDGQFQGIISESHDSKLMLGNYSPAADQAILIQLKHKNQSIQALTFSGQEISFGLGGNVFKYEILISGEDRIVLLSEGQMLVELDVSQSGYQIYEPSYGYLLRVGFLNKHSGASKGFRNKKVIDL